MTSKDFRPVYDIKTEKEIEASSPDVGMTIERWSKALGKSSFPTEDALKSITTAMDKLGKSLRDAEDKFGAVHDCDVESQVISHVTNLYMCICGKYYGRVDGNWYMLPKLSRAAIVADPEPSIFDTIGDFSDIPD